jgi:hypothetical protein
LKTVIPGAVAALIVLVGIARAAQPDTLLELLPLGVVWGLSCGWALWQFGLDPAERAGLGRQLRPPPAAAVPDLG